MISEVLEGGKELSKSLFRQALSRKEYPNRQSKI